MNSTIQLYVDKQKKVKGYPLTSPDRVIDEDGVSIKKHLKDNVKFDVVGEGVEVPEIDDGNSEIREEIENINEQLEKRMNKNKISPDEFNDIQTCLNYASLNGFNVQFPSNKEYLIENTILLPNNVSIDFNNCIIRTEKNIIMVASKDTEKLNNCKLENLRIRGANNNSFTNNTGIKIASIYGIFENIEISNCYDGFIQHADNINGNQVTNIYRNFRIRYNHGQPMKLGDKDNGAITDGWLENINLGNGDTKKPHLYIGSCSGYFIKDIHTWGNVDNSLQLINVAHTNVDGIYLERFNTNAIYIHLKSEININNVKINYDTDNENFIYFATASSSLYGQYSVNINNVVLNESNNKLTGLSLFNAENKNNINVNVSNLSINLTNYTLNKIPNKININYCGILKINSKNELTSLNNMSLARTIKKQINSNDTTVTIEIPINHIFSTYDSQFINVKLVLCRFWDNFSNDYININSDIYLSTKTSTSLVNCKVLHITSPVGNEPIFRYNDGILTVTITKSANATGWIQVTEY